MKVDEIKKNEVEEEEKKKNEDEDMVEVKSSTKVYERTRASTRLRLKNRKTNQAQTKQPDNIKTNQAIAQTINVDPLGGYKDALLNELQDWMKKSGQVVDVKTILAESTLFLRVRDDDVNAICFRWRRRCVQFPDKYGQHFSIADCHLPARLTGHHKLFVEEGGEKFQFDENFMDYFLGSEEKYMLTWSLVDDIYFPLNINDVHWVLSVVHLQEWRIDIYDCDLSATGKEKFDELMRPLCEMLPYLLKQGMSPSDYKRFPKFSLNPFEYNRLPHTIVPKAKNSGDCGMFTVMYMEYLTSSLDVSNVTSDHMHFWRKKWAVRLFHQLIEV